MGCAVALAVGILAGYLAMPGPQVLVEIEKHEYRFPLGDRQALAHAIHLRAVRQGAREIYVRVPGEVQEFELSQLGYFPDTKAAQNILEEKIDEAQRQAESNVARQLFRRLSGQPLRVSARLPFRFEEEVARTAVENLARRINREPRNAQLLIDEHRIVTSRSGLRLSVEATILRMSRAHFEPQRVVEAVVTRVEPQVTEDDLLPVDVTRVLSTFETSFAGKAGARAVNIRRAAKYLDGAVILPGETLSFNSRVGRRVHGRGFVDAPVIINDEMKQDVGGGVCQVATTLHGAAVYGNLEIVRRRSHSRPSGYAPIGLDATVIDGKVDLELRNPYDEPILVHTTFPSRYRLRVELLGRDPTVEVKHAAIVQETEPFGRRVWRQEDLPPGVFKKKQDGSRGMDVLSILRIKDQNGDVERRTYSSKYYPVPEVFHVAQGTDIQQLPPLPENATGLVVDGEDVDSAEDPASATDGSLSPSDVPTIDQADGLGLEAAGRG